MCFLPTASGDADHYIVRFYRHFACRSDASHVSMFRRERGGEVEVRRIDALLMRLDDLEAELAKLDLQIAEARRQRPTRPAAAAEPGQPTARAEQPTAEAEQPTAAV